MQTKLLLAILLTGAAFVATSQEIGHTSTSFFDESRDRDISVEIYYPAEEAGDDTPVAAGTFPQIIFGHGFVMPWSDYENLWSHLVPEGYVMCFVTTEGSFSPSHEDLGLDLAFCASALFSENGDAQSFFYNSLTDKQAIMGHSMGGGGSWLAASGNMEIETVVGLAPAETNPSAISAAENVLVPALVISGSNDAVTPPADHHTPIYNSTASECKAFVNIVEGGHCGFANAGICDFGELFFEGMSREEQQEITNNLLINWFDFFLKNESEAWEEFETYCENESSVELNTTCSSIDVSDFSTGENSLMLSPNPATNSFTIQGKNITSVSVYDACGKIVSTSQVASHSTKIAIDVSEIGTGVYLVRTSSGNIARLVVQ